MRRTIILGNMPLFKPYSFVIQLLLCTFCFLFPAHIVHAKDTLVLGKVTVSERKQIFKTMKPLLDHVVKNMAEFGITKGEIFFASSNEEMIYALMTGRVDWVSETLFSALILSEKAGSEIVLKRVRGGDDYRSIILVNNNSEIKKICDLKGKTIAFEDPGSTSAYFLPYLELLENNFKPVLKSDKRSIPQNIHVVEYVFANSEFEMIRQLLQGKVDAISYSNLDYEELSDPLKAKLAIIHQSDAFPRGLELVGEKLDKNVKHRLHEVLIEMHKDKEGQALLKNYFGTEKFEFFSEDKIVQHAREILRSNIIPDN